MALAAEERSLTEELDTISPRAPQTTFSSAYQGFIAFLSLGWHLAPGSTGAEAPYGRSVSELEVPV